jgi:hypothetical protein
MPSSPSARSSAARLSYPNTMGTRISSGLVAYSSRAKILAMHVNPDICVSVAYRRANQSCHRDADVTFQGRAARGLTGVLEQ